jgi:hypothetical protein
VQLERDPQGELHIERVVVGDEGASGGAAGNGVQRRAFDLHEAFAGQRLADGGSV